MGIVGWLKRQCHRCGKSGKLYRMKGHHYCANCINYVDEIKQRPEGERMMWACHCREVF